MATNQWVGRSLPRLEDQRLLTGQGRFTDDISLPREAHAAFVRSPHAHARIARIDCATAKSAPGVIAIYTGEDLLAAGLSTVPFTRMHKRPDGAEMTVPPRRALTVDIVRFVGDAVALVVADSRDEARDAADLVEVEWEPLTAAVTLDATTRPDAPVVWRSGFHSEFGNIAAIYRNGDPTATDKAFEAAAHVVKLQVVNQRVVANPIEPRALLAWFSTDDHRFHLYCPTQNTHTVRSQVATVLGIAEERLQVSSTDVGGGFGTRGYSYPEHAALCFVARELGRPVKWRADRSENFLSEVHGRDSVTNGELAIDAAYRFTGLRLRTMANIGAYVSNFGACVPAMSGARAATGVYDIPNLDHEVRMVLTHTAPVDAYRGAGRPEIGYMLERLVEHSARILGADPIELRLRNLVRPHQMPYRNAAGHTCDCGDFPKMLQGALVAADWEGFPQRKAAAVNVGRLYGRGIACYVEVTGSARLTEDVQLTMRANGTVILISGLQPIGQGIQTSYAQIIAHTLHVRPEDVRILQGDSDIAQTGGGAGASRGLQVGGSACLLGACLLVESGRQLAAKALEASPLDIKFADGRYRIEGTDREISFATLAAGEPRGCITVYHSSTVAGQTWPNGCQICEVEVDPETGTVKLIRLTAVDDIGKVVNPMIAEGQVHGGVVQGLGQALMEQSIYDTDGQLVTGSFMDYAMPRADAMSELHTSFDQSLPSAVNPLGAKGVGEVGCHGAMPAIVNAVLDAVAQQSDLELDMPLTPEKVWAALHPRGNNKREVGTRTEPGTSRPG